MNKEYEEIRQLLDKAGLIDKSLTFGCFVRLQGVYAADHYRYNFVGNIEMPTESDDDLQVVRLIKKYPHGGSTPDKSDSHWVVQFPGSNSIQNWDDKSIQTSEIIGHDFGIQEIMQWLDLHGGLWNTDRFGISICEKFVRELDLNVSLKDQDCSSLLELIKSIS